MQLDLFGGNASENVPEKKVQNKSILQKPKQITVEEKVEIKNTVDEEKVEVANNIIIEENKEEFVFNSKQDNTVTAESTFFETTNISEVETVYQSLIKRKRGRPRKPVSLEPKIKLKRGRKSFAEINKVADLIDVPNDDELRKKMYYPISTVAKWFNTTNSQIRFWENEFDILKPKKNGKGDRLFRPEDVKNLKTIHHLLRVKKLSIDGAKDYLKSGEPTVNTTAQIRENLQNLKAFLLEIKASL